MKSQQPAALSPFSDLAISIATKLRAEIAACGPIPFSRFMEASLYDPDDGFYSAGKARIGGQGADFYTSVGRSPVFGEILAEQIAECWERLGGPNPCVLIEHGAFDGTLFGHVLDALERHHPRANQALERCIVEPFPALRERQQDRLNGRHVRWVSDASGTNSPVAIHFANELLDAQPVAILRWNGARWTEMGVDWSDGRFVFTERPAVDGNLTRWVNGWPIPPTAPFLAEVSDDASEWIRTCLRGMERGVMLLADYGWRRDEFFAHHRAEGTVRGYRAHQMIRDVLESPGDIDLTAHVDWTAIADAARSVGGDVAGFIDQHRFLVGAGEACLRRWEYAEGGEARRRSFASLSHPETMGRAFKFLLLTKGLPGSARFAGFRYRRASDAL